ncbi:MAG: hypothetical protein O7B35_06125, partial [Deltaproteobacteria bacterium]|nr:hypothetical protein [Deltaproteobacteria bacterium]
MRSKRTPARRQSHIDYVSGISNLLFGPWIHYQPDIHPSPELVDDLLYALRRADVGHNDLEQIFVEGLPFVFEQASGQNKELV